ncbi:flagellar assembly peptidoglycan hydrolase FlgJ [Ketobacter sp.]|uniref:flagellar assembly peptidoglycan hydrolase FlgJ n=1 Tax=Ketobacter sp. TaxID=2083498 RepID=UPI000F1B0DB0|nr:flagellar assembly peptidoglycan hydrolase FlgJ [Ketobacter sp.]RLT92580.1 MAG: flagellar assembly peptidoglycan hydrolase FlgJ [Ketobacter sp.]
MFKPPSNSSPDLYLDFSKFNQLRKMTRDDGDAALRAAAQQMEGVFLNMMLQSMRDANAVFAEGNMLDSRDGQFYQGMYDKQLSLNISKQGGIGLADVIVKQMQTQAAARQRTPDVNTDISDYLKHPVLARPSLPVAEGETDSRSAATAQDSKPAPSSSVVATPNAHLVAEQDTADAQWQSPSDFVQVIYPHAKRAAERLGTSPEAVIAQAVLETGWGQHVMEAAGGANSFNLFGIKADSRWQGDVVRRNTLEYRNGIAAQENAAFRSYRSLDQAFDDYVNFLHSNARYENAIGKKSEAKQWGFDLQNSGYATDPNYGNKIANIMDSDVFQAALKTAATKL